MAALLRADRDLAVLLTAVRTSAGRERLRLAFAEDPGVVLWLNTSVIGRDVLARVEMTVDAPDPEVASEAIRTATTVQVAEWRRRWHEARMRDHEERL